MCDTISVSREYMYSSSVEPAFKKKSLAQHREYMYSSSVAPAFKKKSLAQHRFSWGQGQDLVIEGQVMWQ